ncbi:MAG: hypothetical protein WC979_04320 [Candidatus Pacearchaeota archaeon]|jgi:hypothetical protein
MIKKILIILIALTLLTCIVFAEEISTDKAGAFPADVKKIISDKEENIMNEFKLSVEIQVKNAEVERKKGEAKITISIKETTGSIKIKTKDGTREYANLEKIKINEKESKPTIVIDKDGNIMEAKFTVGKDGKYVFGNREYELTKDTKVYLENGKLYLSLPEGGKIVMPKAVGKEKDNIETIYQPKGTGFLLENGDKWTKGELKFKDDSFYFDDKEVIFGSMTIRNSKSVKTYLDFKGEISKVNGPYLSVNSKDQKIVIGTNSNDDSPTVRFDKDNVYGLIIRPTDHVSVQVLAGHKEGSYFILNGKDRNNKDLAAEVKQSRGYFALNEDNKAVGTYKKDGKIYFRTDGKFSTGFEDDKGTTSVPIEFSQMLISDGTKDVPISVNKIIENGKEVTTPNKMVISANLEVGIGPESTWIPGSLYSSQYPLITRGVSDRLSYNYVQYTKEGFQRYTGVPLSMDRYSESRMTPDKYRMLVDLMNGLTPESKSTIKALYIHQNAYMGGESGGDILGWNTPKGIEVSFSAVDLGYIRHEIIHSITDKLGRGFWNEWQSVGGGSVANVGYDPKDPKEDASEYGHFLVYNPAKTARLLTTGSQAKYYRAKLAVLTKYKVMSRVEYNLAFANAGLAYDDASIQKYIQAVK